MKRGWVKALCAALCVLLLNVGVWGCILGGIWMATRSEGGFWQSWLYFREQNEYVDMVRDLVSLKNEEQSGTLSVYVRQRLEKITETLDADNTNFRFVVTLEDGTVLHANAGDVEQWRGAVYDVCTTGGDYWYITSTAVEDTVSATPVPVEEEWTESRSYRIDYGVLCPLRGEDGFTEQSALYDALDAWAGPVLAGSIVCAVAGLALLIALMCVAGRRRNREGVMLNWHDKIPYDLYLAAEITAQCCIWGFGFVEGVLTLKCNMYTAGTLLAAGMSLLGSALALAFLLTTVSRIKARTLFRNTVIWRLCALLWRWTKQCVCWCWGLAAALPLIWKAVLVCGCYLVLGLLFIALRRVLLWFGLTVVLLACVCWWILQWNRLRQDTERIIGGDTDYQIDSARMPSDLREHADELNNLGQAVSAAVDERMKSEHFKAELITNVSHDLKTPLTSIINYVDLLKKEEIDNEKAREYIDVLDRKSQRLKKLTEDLVEASKASTGALTVTRERVGLVQLADQALAEYGDRLAEKGLTVVRVFPEAEVWAEADGRHLWRVLDNLLSNCAKYALEGTRIYLEICPYPDRAVVRVKNISREELNVPPEQLMERFVRGDASRTTDGSGLGLSIARSLTELQEGRFEIAIDGDLFKASITLPLAEDV